MSENLTLERKSSRWRRAFLKALAHEGVVTYACEQAKISRRQAYRVKNEDPQFAQEWAEAIDEAADTLESEVRRRAFAGSDLLLMFLLKKMRPEFREKVTISSRELDRAIEEELANLKGAKEESDEPETEAVN
jgi:hypothetical protein